MALSVSPLLAQEAYAYSPTPTATAAALSKPSPEFRSYLRLLAADIVTEITTDALALQISSEEDFMKHVDLFAEIVIKNLNSTANAALQGDEKAFVNEVTLLIPELYHSYKATDMNNGESVKKMEMQMMMSLGMLYQKYPTVMAYFSSKDAIANFVDMEKFEVVSYKYESDFRKDGYKREVLFVLRMFAQLAEMMRNNEI